MRGRERARAGRVHLAGEGEEQVPRDEMVPVVRVGGGEALGAVAKPATNEDKTSESQAKSIETKDKTIESQTEAIESQAEAIDGLAQQVALLQQLVAGLQHQLQPEAG